MACFFGLSTYYSHIYHSYLQLLSAFPLALAGHPSLKTISFIMSREKRTPPQEYGVWLPAGEQKEDIMNKVSAFFKNCWSNYVDFMGKYGEYTNRF